MTIPTVDRLMSKSGYARHRGVSPAMVTEWLKKGRIKLIDDKVDAFESDAMLARTLDPARGGKGGKSVRAGVAEKPATQPQEPASAPDADQTSFQSFRALRERYAAKTAQVEYQKTVGELVEASRVKAGAEDMASTVRRALQRLPDVLASRLAAETDTRKIRALLASEIEKALAILADAVESLPEQLTATRQ